MDFLDNLFGLAQQWVFQTLLQPLMFHVGLGDILEDGYAAAGWLLVGLVQVLVLVAVIGPLQRWRPVEDLRDRRAVRTDVFYTLIHRLGLVRVALFFSVQPLFDAFFGWVHLQGVGPAQLDTLVPWLGQHALALFCVYLVIFDFADYWIHRAQHSVEWWWQLHSLHHSQRQMTMWSDNRNHLLDDLLHDSLFVILAQLIGVAPGQFVALVAVTQLSQSFQHANLRVWFGRIGERLWVSPRFHRLHHAIGLGHERAAGVQPLVRGRSPALGGHNFGVLLPWWDMLFRTANFELRWDATGIRDQVEKGRNYGSGFWSQQWLGLKRLAGRA
ncbi:MULTISPECIES: sterol desaturase family protein [Ramlibacter]|uniref:Sterol desaturase family protein n=1 Tax=Ramlibacter aquaticus TaxID=2780094 RepID=A0ABR9SEW7_9BURK|nr:MULTISPECIES: sterol desaturase family protein [Ramlibacter]MBE7940913.1 sterol desaturase family protein [Ramlibacter aquaticus]